MSSYWYVQSSTDSSWSGQQYFFRYVQLFFMGVGCQKGGGINVIFLWWRVGGIDSLLSFCGSADDCSVKQRSRTCCCLTWSANVIARKRVQLTIMAPGSCCCVARVKSLIFIIVCIVFFILGALSGTKIFSSWNQSVVAKLPKKIILYQSFVHNRVITNVSPAASDCHRLQV